MTLSLLWKNVPGVFYPTREMWRGIHGVSFPDDAKSEKMENSERKAKARKEKIDKVLADYDAGKTARLIARDVSMSTDTVVKIIRASGRKVYRGRIRKLGRGEMKVRDAMHARKVVRIEAIKAKVIAAYEDLPKDERSGAKAAANAGICARWACRILKESGRKLVRFGGKPAKNAA